MSRLAELIEELCPDGVEFRPLSDLVRIRNGCDYKTLSPGNVPVYGSGGVMTHVSEALGEGPTVLIPRKGSLDNIFFVEGEFWTVDTIFYTEIASDLDPKFFYYKMKTMRLSQMNEAAGVPSMNQKKLGRIQIPVPPLEVQREIVRILDQFTTLEARRTQYEHYRKHLLAYESLAARGRVRWCALGDVVRICNGRDYKTLSAGDVPVYGSGGVMTYVSDYLSVGPTVLIPRKGSLDNIYFVEGQFWTVDTIFYTEISDALHPKFFFHYMKQMKLSRMNEAAGVPSMTQRKLSSIRIPIPSHEEQRRIADLLDRFDALVNDITSGLPAEIAARRAQYEHYRDRLLSFPEKVVSVSDAS